MQFDLQCRDTASDARGGVLHTSHGPVQTPVFMPVGTAGSVKGIDQDTLAGRHIDAQIILGNTYHLYLRPGVDVIAGAGGLHAFIGWDRPLLTDSGGYQVYSLSQMRKITEDGVSFRSHIDGSAHHFSPEAAIDIQRQIGADIVMAFDECPPFPCDKAYAEKSMRLTHRWLDRCCDQFTRTPEVHGYTQHLAPIVQGSTYEDLRRESAEFITAKDCPVNAIGGLSVGEPVEEMYAMCAVVCQILPEDAPRYLMGVGTPENILECIALGVDMFDCVLPTRNARHGLLYTWDGIINIRNEKWKRDFTSIDPRGGPWSQRYSRAYLRHLVMSKEMLGGMISTVHNLHFYMQLTAQARERICDGTFVSWKNDVVKSLSNRL